MHSGNRRALSMQSAVLPGLSKASGLGSRGMHTRRKYGHYGGTTVKIRRNDTEWSCYVESTRDGGLTWERSLPIELDGKIIQPALFLDKRNNVHMVIRTRKHYMA
eukprot:1196019-Prorocentrum_minimum.AAC.7